MQRESSTGKTTRRIPWRFVGNMGKQRGGMRSKRLRVSSRVMGILTTSVSAVVANCASARR